MNDSKTMRFITRLVADYYLRKPDQAALLQIKYPNLSFLWAALLNEFSFLAGLNRGFRLTALNVELTNRCNLSCKPCLRNQHRPRRECDMSFDTFRAIVDQVPDLQTLLPFQWGEPLLSPILYDCIAYARNRGARVMLTSNGTLLDEEASHRLLESGLTRLTVSFDGGRELQAQRRDVDPERIIANMKRFKQIRDDQGAECALDVSMVVDKETLPHMEEFQRLFNGFADRLQFIPRLMQGLRTKPCRELWRGVLVVLSDGNATLCCADHLGVAAIGNVRDSSPVEIFNSAAMKRIRSTHRAGEFQGICKTCAEFDAPGVSPRFS